MVEHTIQLTVFQKFWTCPICFEEYSPKKLPLVYDCQHLICNQCFTKCHHIQGLKCSFCRRLSSKEPTKALYCVQIFEQIQLSTFVLGDWYYILPQELKLPQIHMIQKKIELNPAQIRETHFNRKFFDFVKLVNNRKEVQTACSSTMIDSHILKQLLIYTFKAEQNDLQIDNQQSNAQMYSKDLLEDANYWVKMESEHIQILETLYDENYKPKYLSDVQCGKEITDLQVILPKNTFDFIPNIYDDMIYSKFIWQSYIHFECKNEDEQISIIMTSNEPISEMQCIFWKKDKKCRVISLLSIQDKILDQQLYQDLNSKLYQQINTTSILMARTIDGYKQVSGFIKLDIKNAFPSVDWQIMSDVLVEIITQNNYMSKDIRVISNFALLYSPKYVQIEEEKYKINKGLFLGTKSAHKLFSVLIDYIFGQIQIKCDLNTKPIVVVDDILIPLDSKRFKMADKILQIIRETFQQFKLQLNECKTGIYIGDHIQFTTRLITANCKISSQPYQKRILLGHLTSSQCMFCQNENV